MPRSFATLPGDEHRVDPVRRERADVQHERAGDRDHLLDLLARVRHHRQRAERERRVRGLVHDDVVGDLVDERLRLAQPAQGVSWCHTRPFTLRTSTGPSPAPSSARPCANRLGRRARRAARRVLERQPAREQRGERGRVRAAGAVRRRDGEPLDGDLDVLRSRRRDGRRRLAVAAGDDRGRRAELDQPLGELGLRRRRGAGERLRLREVRRHDRREREEPRDERIDGVCPRAAARRRSRPAPGRRRAARGCGSSAVGDGLDHRAREEHPGLRGVDAEVGEDRVELRASRTSAGTSCTAVTPTVFCAVSATIADMPCAPAAANAFRSAWMPAPPPLSEPAIVSTRGTLMRLPSPA